MLEIFGGKALEVDYLKHFYNLAWLLQALLFEYISSPPGKLNR